MSVRKRGRPKNPPNFRELLKNAIPTKDMFSPKELETFNSLIEIYLKDIDESELSAADMDDLMGVATNRILELRLLKSSKGSTGKQLDISNAIDKLRKQTDKFKENLSLRRKDRIDPKKFKGFSIIDLAASWDSYKKELGPRAKKFRQEEDSLRESDLLIGNSNDTDVFGTGEDE